MSSAIPSFDNGNVDPPFAMPMPLTPPERAKGLALPFGLVGLAGGVYAADFFRAGCFSHDGGLRIGLFFLVPALASALGMLASAAPFRSLFALAAACTAGAVTFGAFGGFVIGSLIWSPAGARLGAADGAVAGLAFLPAFTAIAAAARRVGRARSGSLVDASDRASVILLALGAMGVGSIAALPRWNPYGICTVDEQTGSSLSPIIAVACAIIVALLFARDVHRLVSARSVLHDGGALRQKDPSALGSSRMAPRFLDLGIGDDLLEESRAEGSVYRDGAPAVRIVRGSPAAAFRALSAATALGAFALCATVIAAGVTVLRSTP